MTLIVCALYCEAKQIIEKLSLKKTDAKCRFQFFEGENVLLAVCGIGCMNAAICTAYAVAKYNVDAILNIGVCGASERYAVGDVIVCNKINSEAGKSFYPDILYKHSFLEDEIFCSRVIQKGVVCDMESAAVMETASVFVNADKVGILKIVSDFGETQSLDGKFVSSLIENNIDAICSWITNFDVEQKTDTSLIEAVCDNLKFTQTMKSDVIKKFEYYNIRHEDISFLNDYLSFDVSTKLERKKIYYEITYKLSQ